MHPYIENEKLFLRVRKKETGPDRQRHTPVNLRPRIFCGQNFYTKVANLIHLQLLYKYI